MEKDTLVTFITIFSSIMLVSVSVSYFDSPIVAYAQEAGFVEVTIVHLDNSSTEPSDFLSRENLMEGYYSIYEDDGDFLADTLSCNVQNSCSYPLLAGIYEASIVDPNSLTTYTIPFEVDVNVTAQVSIQVDQGSFEIIVLDADRKLASISSFGHPGGFLELGWFAMYETNGDFILDGITCNFSEECNYPYDSGTYIVSIRSAESDQVLACSFSIADNTPTSIEFYLDTGDCNQTPTDPPQDNSSGGGSSGGGSNSGSSGSSSGSNNNSGSNSGSSGSSSGSNSQSSSSILKSANEPTALLYHTSYIDNEEGFYHVIGEVQNQGQNPVREVSIYGIFYEGREVIFVKRGFSIHELLDPGEKSPFEIEIRDPSIADSITNYTLTAPSSEPTTNLKQEYLGINVTRQYYDNSTGLYHVEGVVTNYADSEANFVKVAVSVYDQNNSLVYVASKYTISSLEDTIPSAFDISFSPINITQIARISTTVESEEYSMVKTGFLQSPIILTLDSGTYRSGTYIIANGTVGTRLPDEPFAIIDILWPDGILDDREIVRVSSDGSYLARIGFFSSSEFEGETFTVRISYGKHYAEEVFIFVPKR